MRFEKSRYQQGSITRISETNGYARRVRFWKWNGGARAQMSFPFIETVSHRAFVPAKGHAPTGDA